MRESRQWIFLAERFRIWKSCSLARLIKLEGRVHTFTDGRLILRCFCTCTRKTYEFQGRPQDDVGNIYNANAVVHRLAFTDDDQIYQKIYIETFQRPSNLCRGPQQCNQK